MAAHLGLRGDPVSSANRKGVSTDGGFCSLHVWNIFDRPAEAGMRKDLQSLAKSPRRGRCPVDVRSGGLLRRTETADETTTTRTTSATVRGGSIYAGKGCEGEGEVEVRCLRRYFRGQQPTRAAVVTPWRAVGKM